MHSSRHYITASPNNWGQTSYGDSDLNCSRHSIELASVTGTVTLIAAGTRSSLRRKARPASIIGQLARLKDVFGQMPPASIKAQHIYEYLDRRGRSAPVAANREVALLSAVCQAAVRWGYLEANPCRQVRKPGEKPRTRYVTDSEYDAVLALASPNLQVAMDLAVLTGQRQGDIRRLSMADIGKDGLRFCTRKSDKTVIVEWSTDLRQVVQRARSLRKRRVAKFGIQTLLVTKNGTPYTESGFQSAWQRLMMKAEKTGLARFTFHDLRAKSASDDYDPREASRRLAHADPVTTERHYRRLPARVRPLKKTESPKAT